MLVPVTPACLPALTLCLGSIILYKHRLPMEGGAGQSETRPKHMECSREAILAQQTHSTSTG